LGLFCFLPHQCFSSFMPRNKSHFERQRPVHLGNTVGIWIELNLVALKLRRSKGQQEDRFGKKTNTRRRQ
jgi:hypothetical protein